MHHRRFKRSSFGRITETPEYKREQKEKEKQRKIENEENYINIFKEASKIEEKKDEYILFKNEDSFFKEIKLKTNHVHIIRGGNGQGKSTLLNQIVDSNFLGVLSSFKDRLKISSTNKQIADALNFGMAYSPYKLEDEGWFRSNLKYDLTNFKGSVTIFTDFSVSYFRENTNDVFTDISEEYDKESNGERKIKGINSIFYNLKKILQIKEEDLIKGLNLFVVMDEPESGLSIDIQEEFSKKINRYLNLALKNNKISLTFIISSHSYVWKETNNLTIHNISSFKEENKKKIYKNVFI